MYHNLISIATSYGAVYSSCKSDDHILFERDLEDTSCIWDIRGLIAQEVQIVRRIQQFFLPQCLHYYLQYLVHVQENSPSVVKISTNP